MPTPGHIGPRRLRTLGLLAVPVVAAGWIGAGSALGAGSSKPSMEVLPKTTGLKYSETVEIKGHHLPKGSGSVAATICGLQDASGRTIASPGANDCAGASEIGKLVIVKSWQSNGEFDTKYTLPASGQTFGKNARFCNRSHRCALVVADANPDKPAYYIETKILFFDQGATTNNPKSTTTQPKSTSKPTTTTTTTTQPPGAAVHIAGGASGSSGAVKFGASATVASPASGAAPSLPGLTTPPAPAVPAIPALPAPSANPVPAPAAQALNQVCTQLSNAVKQAGGDPSALLAACAAVANGNGPQQLQVVLQSPSLLCLEGASAWQNNQQITDACQQAAAAIAPATAPLGAALNPVVGSL